MLTPAKTLLLALGLTAALGAATAASAETRFQATRPARAEVNMRLAKLNHKITVQRREHRVGPLKAKLMRAELRNIRREERVTAFRHGTHLTRFEHRRLNRQETLVGKQMKP
jgi:hypothetical protein